METLKIASILTTACFILLSHISARSETNSTSTDSSIEGDKYFEFLRVNQISYPDIEAETVELIIENLLKIAASKKIAIPRVTVERQRPLNTPDRKIHLNARRCSWLEVFQEIAEKSDMYIYIRAPGTLVLRDTKPPEPGSKEDPFTPNK